MNDQIQQELLKRLDTLAAKLGVTAEHLWTVLVTQTKLWGTVYTVNAVVFFLLAGVFAALAYSARTREGRCDACNRYTTGDAKWVLLFCSGIAFAVCAVNATHAFLSLHNPEYYALKEILEALSK